MTARRTLANHRSIEETEPPLKPHYKVRVVLPNAMLHAASWTRPWREYGGEFEADWIGEETDRWWEYGDVLGFIRWNEVVAVSWRWNTGKR